MTAKPQEQWLSIEEWTASKLKKENIATLKAMNTRFGNNWTHIPNKGRRLPFVKLLMEYKQIWIRERLNGNRAAQDAMRDNNYNNNSNEQLLLDIDQLIGRFGVPPFLDGDEQDSEALQSSHVYFTVIKKTQRIIVEYWCRTVLERLFINDMIDIVLNYAHIQDVFDPLFANNTVRRKNLTIDKKGSSLVLKDHVGNWVWRTGFGSLVATKGAIYRWKVKIVEGKYSIMIGVVEKDQCENIAEYWWHEPYAYAYYSAGSFYHTASKEYGMIYQESDTIDVILDLKNYNVSFAKNNTVFEIAGDLDDKNADYKLAISFYEDDLKRKAVEIISVDIE